MGVLRINGRRLAFEEYGQGVPILLLHGLGNSKQDWEFQIPALKAAGYRLIVPDLPGFGASDRLGQFTIAALAADMRSLLGHCGVADAHLLGYSMGGAVAFQLAVEEPARWRSLAVLCSVPSFRPLTWQHRKEYLMRRSTARVIGMQRLAEIVSERLFGHMPKLRAKMLPRYAANDQKVYLALLAALAHWDVRGRLSAVRCPVRLWLAAQDYFSPADVREAMAALPQAEVVMIPDSRHGLPMEKPGEINPRLMRFFAAADAACQHDITEQVP